MSQINYNPPKSKNGYGHLPDVNSFVPPRPDAKLDFDCRNVLRTSKMIKSKFFQIVASLKKLLGPEGAPEMCEQEEKPAEPLKKRHVGVVMILLIFIFISPSVFSMLNGISWPISEDFPSGYKCFDETLFCYKVTIPPVLFEEAKKSCESEGSHLVTIHSQSEYDFLGRIYNESARETGINPERSAIWIGYHYLNGKSQRAEKELNMLERQPFSTIMVLNKVSGYSPHGNKWNNGNKESAHGFICKRPSEGQSVKDIARTTITESTIRLVQNYISAAFGKTDIPPPLEFTVTSKLATVLYSDEIPGGYEIRQVPNPQYNGKYTIRVVLFKDNMLAGDMLKKFKVFDNGVYKATVYDIYQTNHNAGLEGSNFVISNVDKYSIRGFALLISPVYGFRSSVTINPSYITNVTQSYSSGTAHPTVYHEITDTGYLTSPPTYLTNISFVGDGEVRIYAGCVTDEDVPGSMAVINADNFKNFENLEIRGKCRTYSVSNGVFQYYKMDDYLTDNHKPIGHQGVIKSHTYPYPSTLLQTKEYLILGPSVPDKFFGSILFRAISVDYEVVHIAKDAQVWLEMGIKGADGVKTLTSADSGTVLQVNDTSRQCLVYRVPSNSEGILIRYTVRKASGQRFKNGSS